MLVLLTRINFVQSAWESRLSSPLIAKLDVDKFFYEVERKFSNEKRGSAIDVDLFAAAAQGDVQVIASRVMMKLNKCTKQPSS